MKGVLLLGGSGSRLNPLNKVCNKHLINVGGKPMAQWNVEKFAEVGIKDIIIITGKEHMGSIVEYFGDGSEFGVNFTYKVQREANGIAGAFKLINNFIDDDEFFFVILGDNIFEDALPINLVKNHIRMILTIKEVEDPSRYGVLMGDGSIVEKPEDPDSNKALCGVYGFRYDFYFEVALNNMKLSKRKEYEVVDVINSIRNNCNEEELEISELKGFWTDAGTHESLKLANKYKYDEK